MANAAQTKSSGNPIDPEAKFKRLQEIGFSHWIVIPVALMLAARFGLEVWYGHITALLSIIGAVFFFFGYVGRQKLAERQKGDSP